MRGPQTPFDDAIRILPRSPDRALSFTDATTVALVRARGIDHVLSFDDDLDGLVDRVDPSRAYSA